MCVCVCVCVFNKNLNLCIAMIQINSIMTFKHATKERIRFIDAYRVNQKFQHHPPPSRFHTYLENTSEFSKT